MFYRGEIARMTARYHERAGGLIRYEDMAGFEPDEPAPLRIDYHGYDIYQTPPNSGGIVMLMALSGLLF